MAKLGRRFVNIVAAGKYRTGLLSVHRIDISKHLFYPPSAASSEARSLGDDETSSTLEEELPAPCAIFSDDCARSTTVLGADDADGCAARSTAFLSLVGRRRSSSRILFINGAGDSIMHCAGGHPMPGPRLPDFAGPVEASVSVGGGRGRGGAAKEESMYVLHGVRDGAPARFHVLRLGAPPMTRSTPDRWGVGGGCYWQSLPPPPFALDRHHAGISSYTVVDGGHTICVSILSTRDFDAIGATWCFDTIRGEWWHAGDWMMPFDGRAEYLADLDLWLGFTSYSAGTKRCTRAELCTTSGLSLSAMATKKQPPTLLQRLWKDDTPKHQLVELVNLGSGRFAIARMFHEDDGYTSDYDSSFPDADQILEVTGVEIRPRQQPRHGRNIWSSKDGLELIPHKSITYMCGVHRIHQVL